MRKLRFILLVLMVSMLCCSTVLADENVPEGEEVTTIEEPIEGSSNETPEGNLIEEPTKNILEEGKTSPKDDNKESKSTDGLIVMGSSSKGNRLSVTIKNNSEVDIKNASIIYSDKNRLSAFDNFTEVGVVRAGKSKTVSVSIIDIGHGFFKRVSNSLGGATSLFILGFVVIAIVSSLIITAYLYKKKLKKEFKIGSFVSLFMVVAFALLYTLLISNKPKYTPLETGNNFTLESTSDYFFELKYNQDVVETKVTERDIDIDFDIKYEYDENIPVLAEPEVKKKGIKGAKHIITTTTFVNGKKDKKSEDEEVTKEPTTQIEVKGTKSVKKIENIEAKKSYVPDNTLYVGQYELDTAVSDSKENIGRREVLYKWDAKKGKMVSEETITKEAGTNIWKAGTLVLKTTKIKAKTKYVPVEEEEIGYTKTIKESVDGLVTTYYTTEIDTKTGKPIDDTDLTYVKEETEKATNGEVEVGVKKIEDISTPCEEVTEYLPDKWDNYKEVLEPGKDTIERVTSIMKLDTKTGKVTSNVKEELSRFIVQEAEPAHVAVGSKSPTWVQEKEMTDQVQFNTVYIPDDTGKLKDDEKEVVQEGKMGRLYTTRMVAVDDTGTKIEGYEPKVIEKDALVKPTDEVVKVAKNSKLLKNN